MSDVPDQPEEGPRPSSDAPKFPGAAVYRGAKDVCTDRAEVLEFPAFADLARRLQQPPVRTLEKESAPLMSRGPVVGPRSRKNTRPPYLVVLDVDGSEQTPEGAAARLSALGIPFALYTTWSHGSKPGSRFRIYPALAAMGPRSLKKEARRIARLAGVEDGLGKESFNVGQCFYLPSHHPDPDRAAKFRLIVDCPPDCPWTVVPEPDAEPPAPRRSPEPGREVDAAELRSALATIPNGEHEQWIRVGMALRSCGLRDDEAREIWDEWSRGQDYGDYSDEKQESKWRSFSDRPEPGCVGVGTIFLLARRNGWRPPRATAAEDFADGGGDEDQPVPMARTHAGNAARLAREHGHELRYVQSLSAWIHFDGKRWRMDHGLSAKRLAKSDAIRIFAEAGALQGDEQQKALKWAASSQMAHGVRGTIEMAQPDLEISSRRLDPNPMLLNVSNGTLDLRTHQLRPHDPADMITKVAPTAYDPAARCEHWERFLEQVLPDEEVRAFFRRLMGYALQGRQSEKIFAIVYGPPNGGKSTAINACARALGNASKGEDATDDDDSAAVTRFYAEGTPISTFGVQKYGGGNRPELAKLMGARLVIVNEIKGEELESSVMKSWTGGDMVSATPKYGHPLGFYADGTIVMVGNELPEIAFDDDAMWSRVVVVRFPVEIPDHERDRGLSDRFDPKGVLAWMVRGHAEYARIGLQPPKASRLEKKRYRRASDPLKEFWEDCVVVEAGARISRDELYHEYQIWADRAGIPARDRISRGKLVKRVNRRELSSSVRWMESGGWRGWVGARLAAPDATAECHPRALTSCPEKLDDEGQGMLQ